MIRTFLRSAVHNARVTSEHSSASLVLDPVLMRAAELLTGEQVEVVSATTGARSHVYVEPGQAGEVRVRMRAGETISILCYGTLHDGQTLTHRAKMITVDSSNRLVSLTEL